MNAKVDDKIDFDIRYDNEAAFDFNVGLLIACTMSVQLALVFLVTLPVLAVILAIIVSRVAPLYGVMQGAMDRLNEALQEDLVAIRAIKAYVREDYVAERFERVNELLAKSSTRTL